jgi:hypothetical protein
MYIRVIRKLINPSSLLLNGYRGSFQGVQRPRREGIHSPASSAEARNEHSYTSTPPTCLRGVCRDNFYLYI